jgi:hypothetical protein
MDIPFKLEDLVPKETSFTLSTAPGKTFTLCRWSLRVRVWAKEKYGSDQLKTIFEELRIDEIADMTFFMLKDKEQFPGGKDEFLDLVTTTQDQINVVTALLGAVGIGEPEIKKIKDSMAPKGETPDPKIKSPKKKTGAKSLTP